MIRRCPVCWQGVESTPASGKVFHHLVLGKTCDMTGQPFDLCYPLTATASS